MTGLQNIDLHRGTENQNQKRLMLYKFISISLLKDLVFESLNYQVPAFKLACPILN